VADQGTILLLKNT